MIARISAVDRAAVDDAIDASLARLQKRGAGLGDAFDDLAASMVRAASGGKRFRPALVLAAFRACGGTDGRRDAAASVAAAFELLHTAFVIHDDVIDHDTMRRGVPNVAGEFRRRALGDGATPSAATGVGEAAAILAGDVLLYEATRLVAAVDLPADLRSRLLDLLDDAVLVSAAGELADVEHAAADAEAEDDSLIATAHDKTAVYSFAAPLAAGAVIAGADETDAAALAACGTHLGLAFQLVDDLIGAFGTSAQAGRDAGVDLREAKQTPLIALARRTEGWHAVRDTLAVAHTGPIAVLDAQRALDESGARAALVALIDSALDAARTRAQELGAAASALVDRAADAIRERIP